jgi:hypothetical protein
MEVKARMLGEPVFDFLLLVGRVVIGNAVAVQMLGRISIDADGDAGTCSVR